MNKKSSSFSNMGTVSLLMIFIVLCLVTFATLSLSSSIRDYHYSQKLAEHNREYYEASNAANEILADIDQVLHDFYIAYQTGTDAENYPQTALLEQLDAMDGITIDTDTEEPIIRFEISVSDTQLLKVELIINGMDSGYHNLYRIRTWQKAASGEWSEDNNNNEFNLFQP